MTAFLAFEHTNRPILEAIAAQYGGNSTSDPDHPVEAQERYLWRISGRRARRALLDMWPYLRIKRPQAELILTWFGECALKGKVTSSIDEWSLSMKAQMHALNRKGPEVLQ